MNCGVVNYLRKLEGVESLPIGITAEKLEDFIQNRKSIDGNNLGVDNENLKDSYCDEDNKKENCDDG